MTYTDYFNQDMARIAYRLISRATDKDYGKDPCHVVQPKPVTTFEDGFEPEPTVELCHKCWEHSDECKCPKEEE